MSDRTLSCVCLPHFFFLIVSSIEFLGLCLPIVISFMMLFHFQISQNWNIKIDKTAKLNRSSCVHYYGVSYKEYNCEYKHTFKIIKKLSRVNFCRPFSII